MLKCGKEVVNSIYKRVVCVAILTGSILLLPIFSHAQGGDLPCGGDDPTTSNPCPLDTWVWVLAIIAVIMGAIYLQRKQTLQRQA